MRLMTNKIVIFIRKIFRFLYINKLISKLLYSSIYEQKFSTFIMNSIKTCDVVWDVGANLGFYSIQFAEVTGNEGIVYSFEPSPQNIIILKEAVKKYKNIITIPIALASKSGRFKFVQGKDELGATSRFIIGNDINEDKFFDVYHDSGDNLIITNQLKVPNIIKIDVEGFEYEVLLGLERTLKHTELRCIFIEIHFDLLDKRGYKNGPDDIITILESSGFKINWIDYSHIAAIRIINETSTNC